MRPILISADFDLQRLVDADGKLTFDADNKALWVPNPSPAVPTNNGVGVLADAISCKVKTVLNGEDELEMTYPITGDLFDQLALRALIVANVAERGNQPYRIYRITKPLNGIITVYARHLVYDLSGIVVEPFTANGIQAALTGLKNHAMTNCPFTFVSGRTTDSRFAVTAPTAAWSLMGGTRGSLLDVYGGEYSWDGYTIRLENHIGSNNGVSVRYGVNMTDLEQDARCDSCYTGVVAYWKKEDSVIHSPVVAAVGTYGYVKILPVDMSDKWEDMPTKDQLTAAAEAYIVNNQIGVPSVSWRVSFVQLGQTEEYKDIAALEHVSLGDTVGVHFTKLGVDATARVNSIEWDVLLERYATVNLGSIKSNIADTIATQARELEQTPTREEVASLSSVIAAGIMGAKGGSVRFLDTDNDGEPDTLYIADNPEPTLAQKVWRFNYEGWAASSNGYDGPFTMGATLEGGLIADFITAGTMSANRIRGGTMAVGGYNNEAAKIDLYDENSVFFGRLSGTGLWMSDNATTATRTNKTLFAVQDYANGDYLPVAIMRRTLMSDGTPRGALQLYIMNEDRTDRTLGATITGDGAAVLRKNLLVGDLYVQDGNLTDGTGKITCKELWVNGRQIT